MSYTKISKEKSIAITGAAGFIGSGLVRFLNDKGYDNLLLVDDLDLSCKWKNLVGKRFQDFISRDSLFDFLKERGREIAAIVHLGACSDTTEEDAGFLIENNYRYSQRLCEYALQHGIRFIYASSAATYGDGKRGFSDDEELFGNLRPLNKYAFSKQLFDMWILQKKLLKKVVGLKYFNVFGPNEAHKGKMASVVYKMSQIIQKEGAVKLFKSNDPQYADGEQKRDFIYVKDAVLMTAAFLLGPLQEKSGIFNIGRGEAVSWNRLCKAIFQALNAPCKIEYIDMPLELNRQYQNYTCANMGKFFKAYGPLELMSIEESVEDYVKNHILKEEVW